MRDFETDEDYEEFEALDLTDDEDELEDITADVDTTPILFSHCKNSYRLMQNNARHAIAEGVPVFVYEGFITKLICGEEGLNLPIPYYTFITRALKQMKCVRQLRRGASKVPSMWELLQPPSIQLFEDHVSKGKNRQGAPAQRKSDIEIIYQQISDLSKRLHRIEDMLAPPGATLPPLP